MRAAERFVHPFRSRCPANAALNPASNEARSTAHLQCRSAAAHPQVDQKVGGPVLVVLELDKRLHAIDGKRWVRRHPGPQCAGAAEHVLELSRALGVGCGHRSRTTVPSAQPWPRRLTTPKDQMALSSGLG